MSTKITVEVNCVRLKKSQTKFKHKVEVDIKKPLKRVVCFNVGVSSKHIPYRTKHSFVNILHMFFLSQQAQAACCVVQFKHKVEVDIKKEPFKRMVLFLCRRRPIFTGGCPPTIFGTRELNYRVRYGNGWTLSVINTDYEL